MSGIIDIGDRGGDEGGDSALAGEYVLGTLPPETRAAVQRRIAVDPAFAREVAWWEDRLAPLARLAGESAPPAGLWTRLEASLGAPAGSSVVAFPRQKRPRPWNNVGLWRGLSAGSLAIAAALAAFIVLHPPPPPGHVLVAGLSQPGAPTFLAEVTPDGIVTIRPTGTTKPPAGRDFELWRLAQGESQPTSLGVLPASGKQVKLGKLPAPGTQLLVSVEPVGGSPTGQPTGPVVFAGALAAFD